MTAPNRPELQRHDYWQGQMLRSRDLNDQLALDAQRRWWHARAVHEAFGVSFGLNVGNDNLRINGQQHVRIAPGLAYDCHGRELCLADWTNVPVPSNLTEEENWTLLIRYPRRGEVFGNWHEDGSSAAPEFVWKPMAAVAIADGVPVGRIGAVSGIAGAVTFRADPGFRSSPVRKIQRARIHSGVTIRGKTRWETWEEQLGVESTAMGVAGIEVKVDTSSGGFTKIPCYFAWLQGSLTADANGFVPYVYQRTMRSTVTSFTFSLIDISPLDPPVGGGAVSFFLWNLKERTLRSQRLLLYAQQQGLHVCWLAIEDILGNAGHGERKHANA